MTVMEVREAERKLDKRVELDDAYLGGEYPGAPLTRPAIPPQDPEIYTRTFWI